MIRSVFASLAVALLVAGLIAAPASASVIHSASGLSSAGIPVTFEAKLTIAGDVLTVELANNSSVGSLNPNDVLGSYYFDVVDVGNNRPALTYSSAFGDVYVADKDSLDLLLTPTADLMALVPGDYTWQYKAMDETLIPFLGFGIGTVGNSTVSPNNFMGNIVDGVDYSIYAGDITTQNLTGKALVKDMATFTFTGLTGFTEADISPTFAFGLGTAPDSFLTPEPATALLLATGALVLLRRKRAR
ncbi:MAG TPA: XDD4 family exosortase-dependent surface protein [Phycisphaerae bacterium]|nr:XDD4 family exosortase-dependent surface protein [Phycisphaerae bacterium]